MFTYHHRRRFPVDRAYHKIRGSVKKFASTATSWGRGEAYEVVEKMIGKLLYCLAGILHNNDEGNKRRQAEAEALRRRFT
jgi:hypothetical protein